jgi:hypothetical protein
MVVVGGGAISYEGGDLVDLPQGLDTARVLDVE